MNNNAPLIIKTLVVNTCKHIHAKYASSLQGALYCRYYDLIESKRFIHYDVTYSLINWFPVVTSLLSHITGMG
jgi:hypothetical protein